MTELTRRRLIIGGAAAAVSAFVAACTRRSPREEAAPSLDPTPACDDVEGFTPEQAEGPYFTPNSPERTDLFADVDSGTKLVLTGTVLATNCEPVRRALVDFWQCDADGTYDNDGFRLRGHQFTDTQGRYELTTVEPGIYPGRTKHIHVKVQAPNGPVLTTQLYFPGVAENRSDGIYREECLIEMRDGAGTFNFVIQT